MDKKCNKFTITRNLTLKLQKLKNRMKNLERENANSRERNGHSRARKYWSYFSRDSEDRKIIDFWAVFCLFYFFIFFLFFVFVLTSQKDDERERNEKLKLFLNKKEDDKRIWRGENSFFF